MSCFLTSVILVFLSVLFIPAFNEIYSPLIPSPLRRWKDRENLLPFKHTIELALTREWGAYADLAVCTSSGVFTFDKAISCKRAFWKAPKQTQGIIEAEEQYRQGFQEFDGLFEQVRENCLDESSTWPSSLLILKPDDIRLPD